MRPYIGIKMLQLNAQNAAQMQQRDSKFPAITHGILVPSVTTGSPAAKAGLQQGDIITGEHIFIRESAISACIPPKWHVLLSLEHAQCHIDSCHRLW